MPLFPPNTGGGGGTWERLSTATASASATIDFTLPAGYRHYVVVLSHVVPATDGVDLWLRTSTDGGSSFDAGASDYRWGVLRRSGTGAAWVEDTADSEITLNSDLAIGNLSTEGIHGEVLVINPAAAAYCSILAEMSWFSTATAMYTGQAFGQRVTAADVDAIRFLMSSSNIASGTFELWGMSP